VKCKDSPALKRRPPSAEEGAPGSHQIPGWVDPRAGLDTKKNFELYENRTSFIQVVASHVIGWDMPVILYLWYWHDCVCALLQVESDSECKIKARNLSAWVTLFDWYV